MELPPAGGIRRHLGVFVTDVECHIRVFAPLTLSRNHCSSRKHERPCPPLHSTHWMLYPLMGSDAALDGVYPVYSLHPVPSRRTRGEKASSACTKRMAYSRGSTNAIDGTGLSGVSVAQQRRAGDRRERQGCPRRRDVGRGTWAFVSRVEELEIRGAKQCGLHGAPAKPTILWHHGAVCG